MDLKNVMNAAGMGKTRTAIRTGKDARTGQEGFTLIELLIVVAIILLMAVLLIPSFVGFLEGRKLRAGGAQVESALLRAKSAAIQTRRMHYILLDRWNQRIALVDSGLDSRSDFDFIRETGDIVFRSASDDAVVRLDAEQRRMPGGVYFARLSEAEESILFSEEIRCYPDGSIITAGRPDVPYTTYLDGPGNRGTEGGDIVLTLGLWDGVEMQPVFAPAEGAEDIRRGCFMDLSPTTGRIRYEVDTWKRDYH